jgi:hypothetical protein
LRPVPLQNAATWSDLWVRRLGLCGLVVLVDHTAEHLPAPHRPVQRHDDPLVMIGWPLLPGLVQTVAVIVPHIGPEYRSQVRSTVDQHPVSALRPYRPHPVWCQNYVTAADLRRLELAGVLHGTPAFASTRAGHPPAGPREDYREYMNSQSEDHARLREGEYLPGTQCGHGPPFKPGHQPLPRRATNAPGACITVSRSATRATVAATASVPHPAARVTDGITERDYPSEVNSRRLSALTFAPCLLGCRVQTR